MIIVKLQGGLGNQMFQYALGRHLALIHNTTLKLDRTTLLSRSPQKNFVCRDYDLDIFNLVADFASPQEVAHFHDISSAAGIFRHAYLRLTRQYIKEPSLNFYQKIFRLSGDLYLDGYWQSELYFTNIAETIRRDFTVKSELLATSRSLAEKIVSGNSVCIHVRRGDFISNPIANKFHGTCDTQYYLAAIRYLKEKISNPFFLIFTDDIPWCEQHLAPHGPSLVVGPEHDGGKFVNKFKLMTLCRHYIISNSTFAWWGAWLNPGKEKIVIAPRQWFRDKRANNQIAIIPSHWVKL